MRETKKEDLTSIHSKLNISNSLESSHPVITFQTSQWNSTLRRKSFHHSCQHYQACEWSMCPELYCFFCVDFILRTNYFYSFKSLLQLNSIHLVPPAVIIHYKAWNPILQSDSAVDPSSPSHAPDQCTMGPHPPPSKLPLHCGVNLPYPGSEVPFCNWHSANVSQYSLAWWLGTRKYFR